MLDAERIELEALAVSKGGKLMVDDVVDAARDEDSPLHRHFTWDDSKAADEHRKQQARALISRLKITVLNPDPTVVRAFVSLPADRNGGGYTATVDVLNDEVKRRSIIEDILRRIAYWREQSRLFASAELNVAINQLENAAFAEAQIQPDNRESA